MRTTHVGLVLDTGEINGYDDSDFYAVVWNPAEKKIERVTYASTRGWTYPNGAAIDATPEVRQEADAFLKAGRREAALAAWRAKNKADARSPIKGRVVVVARGRKVPLGTEGVVIWKGAGHYGERVGVKDAAGTVHWTAAKNVDVVNPEQFEAPDADGVAYAERVSDWGRGYYRQATAAPGMSVL
jgi:hypothetical protein